MNRDLQIAAKPCPRCGIYVTHHHNRRRGPWCGCPVRGAYAPKFHVVFTVPELHHATGALLGEERTIVRTCMTRDYAKHIARELDRPTYGDGVDGPFGWGDYDESHHTVEEVDGPFKPGWSMLIGF